MSEVLDELRRVLHLQRDEMRGDFHHTLPRLDSRRFSDVTDPSCARLGSLVLMVAALFLLILLILVSVVVPAYDLDPHF